MYDVYVQYPDGLWYWSNGYSTERQAKKWMRILQQDANYLGYAIRIEKR